MRLLAQREHSRAELETKLRSRLRPRAGAAPDAAFDAGTDAGAADAARLQGDIRRTLDELESQGLVSDRRAAEALLQAKAPRFGSRRLEQMLRARSLTGEFADQLLQQARSTELDRALAVWRRRFGQPPADLRERARQQRFLAGRGFDAAEIERVMKRAGQGPDDDAETACEAESDPD